MVNITVTENATAISTVTAIVAETLHGNSKSKGKDNGNFTQ